MRLALALACGWLGAAVGAAQVPVPQAVVTEIEEEFADEVRLRRLALVGESALSQLEAALDSPRWSDRVRGLEVLVRRRRLGLSSPPALWPRLAAALSDGHPNVRARALQALPLDAAPLLTPELAAALAADELPLVHLQLARALGRLMPPFAGTLLIELALAGDVRVTRAARASLAALAGEDAARAQGVALERLLEAGDLEGALELARLVARVPGPAPRLGGFGTALGLEAPLSRARMAGESAPGMLLAFLVGDRVDDEARQALVQFTARRMEPACGQAVGGALLRVLWRRSMDAHMRRASAGMRLGIQNSPLLRDLPPERRDPTGHGPFVRALDGHLAAGRDGGLLAMAFALFDLWRTGRGEEGVLADLSEVGEDPSPMETRLLVYVLDELGAELVDPTGARASLAAWLAPERAPELRQAVTEALARSLFHHGSDAARELLVLALEDPLPAVSTRAFRALATDEGSAETDVPLARYYGARSADEQLELARAFRAEGPRSALRAVWLAQVEAGGALGIRASELLAGFEGDGEVARSLLRAANRAAQALDDGTKTEDAEPALRAYLAAAALVAPERAVEDLRRALARSSPSAALARTAAAALGRTAAGCSELVVFLGAAFDARVRLEAALALLDAEAGESDAPAALRIVFELGDGVEWSVRRRCLAALATHHRAPAVEAYLWGRVRSEQVGSVERVAALEALGIPGRADQRERMLQLVLTDRDLDLRKVAVARLGAAGEPAVEALTSLLDEPLDYGPGGGVELAREDLLCALAATGAFPADRVDPWFTSVFRAGEQRFAARLLGRPVPDLEFVARTELEVTRSLLRGQRLGPWLEALAAPERLDPLLANELAGLALEEGRQEAAETLLGLSLVGEPGGTEAFETERGQARLRLLGLAWRAGRYAQVDELASELLLELLEARLPRAVVGSLLGSFRPCAGLDPVGRLASLPWLARAHRRLDAGDGAGARAFLETALQRHGRSALAADACRRLAARLDGDESQPRLDPERGKR